MLNKNHIRAFFDEKAKHWDEHQECNDAVIQFILQTSQVGEGSSVLDIGCGTGVLIPYYLGRHVKQVVGVDFSSEMVERARQKYEGDTVSFLQLDAEEDPLPTGFDVCMIYNAFPHFPHPESLIDNVAKALVPGGRLTIAHGASKKQIDAHHQKKAKDVSLGLLPAEALSTLLLPWFEVDQIVSDHEKYLVSGIIK